MNGYKQTYSNRCSRSAKNGNVMEHLVIAESALGKPLPRRAQVHHFDGDHTNNANTNLVICEDAAYHKLLHVRQRVKAAGGNPNTDALCTVCRSVKPVGDFNISRRMKATGRQTSCRACQSKYCKSYRRTA
jgi:hypothetical protein